MTTRIGSSELPRVTLVSSGTRMTPSNITPFSSVLRGGAALAVHGAEAAALRLPGGEVIAAAVTSPAQGTDVSLGGTPLAGSPSPALGASPSNASATPVSSAASASGTGTLEVALQEQAESTMYYLDLQQRIQNENRYYTTVSNVLKAQHDTVKSAIGNIR